MAVNAATEATKAGEHGKGFGVVAAEIKRLADGSKKATGQVQAILQDILTSVSSTVMMVERGSQATDSGLERSAETGEAIQTLTNNVEEMANATMQIAASSQEQLTGVEQVGEAMSNIDDATRQNAQGAEQLRESASNLKGLGSRLATLSNRWRI